VIVSISTTVDQLWRSLNQLRDSLRLLQLTAVEDRPRHSDLLPVEALGERVEDVLGSFQEGFEAAAGMPPPSTEPDQLELRRALAVIQDRIDQISLRIGFDLASHQRLADLDELAADRGGEWQAWTTSVCCALDHCQPSLSATQRALLACWLELTEPSPAAAGPSSIRPAGDA
jgi:hypothetical protein